MSLDLYERETAERLAGFAPVQSPEPSAFDGFLRGTGMGIVRNIAMPMAKTTALISSIGAMAYDNNTLPRGAIAEGPTALERHFKGWDDIIESATNYWTPKPGEVGMAGQLTGDVLGMLGGILAAPMAAPVTTFGAVGMDLSKKGVGDRRAQEVAAIQAAGLATGIWMPILGQNLWQRVLVGGAGYNALQGVVVRGASGAVLEGLPVADEFKALDLTGMTLDVILGMGFGAGIHYIPALREARAQGKDAWEKIDAWARGLTPEQMDAIVVLREAQHLNVDSTPGKPATEADLDAHVERVRTAMEQMHRGEPVRVDDVGRPAAPEAPADTVPPSFEPAHERLQEMQARAEELVVEAEAVRVAENLPHPDPALQEPPVARPLLADVAELPLPEQARAIGEGVAGRLRALKIPEDEAVANGAIWEAFFRTAADRYGVASAELMAKYGLDITRMEAARPGALAQSARTDIERVLNRFGVGGNKDFPPEAITVGKANSLAKQGDPDAGIAALLAYVTHDFSVLSGDKGMNKPATRALVEYVKAMPPDQTGPLYRVVAFPTEAKRAAFLEKIERGETTGLQTERPVMSFTTENPTGRQPMTHIGRDVASQFGEHTVVIEIRGPAGTPLRIGRDVSKAYGQLAEYGTDVLVPKDTTLLLRSIEIDDRTGEPLVRLEPTPERPGMTLFQPAKGQIQFAGGRTIIDLFKNADASTFPHETGHLFLEITKDMAGRPDAPEGAVQDWATLATWLKVEGGQLTREQHEQFARGFEAYLMEGKAPSDELHSVFQRFRDWLLEIYHSVARLRVELSDDVRGVIDRMLASQAEDPSPLPEGPQAQRSASSEPPPPPGEGVAAAESGRPTADVGPREATMSAASLRSATKKGPFNLRRREATEELARRETAGEGAFNRDPHEMTDKQLAKVVTGETYALALKAVAALEVDRRAERNAEMDAILQDQVMREELQGLADNSGWAQIGGRYDPARAQAISKEEGGRGVSTGVVAFTEWIPKAEWWMNRPEGATEGQAKETVRKALAGEPLKAAEKRILGFLVDTAHDQMEGYKAIPEPEARAIEEDWALDNEGAAPTRTDVADSDLTARAAAIDEAAVERAAQVYETDNAGFLAAMRSIIDGHEHAQAQAAAASRAANQRPEGAGPAAQQAATAGGAEAAAPEGGEPAGTRQQADPVTLEAERFVAEHPDQLLRVGTNPDGTPVTMTAKEYLEDARARTVEAMQDKDLLSIAAACLLGRS